MRCLRRFFREMWAIMAGHTGKSKTGDYTYEDYYPLPW